MIADYFIPLSTAFWLGILTSISPCPLATNIAAISYVGRRVDSPVRVFFAGALYTSGRMFSYLVLAVILVSSMLSAPVMSHVLQKYMNMILGPILILAGVFLLEIIPLNVRGFGINESLQKKVDALGIWGAGFLGIIFALSFCPTSAAIFFGSLLPLALKHRSDVLIPCFYGIATALPVFLFAVLLAIGTNRVAQAYNRIVIFEKWARTITGVLFVLIGSYYCLVHIFNVSNIFL